MLESNDKKKRMSRFSLYNGFSDCVNYQWGLGLMLVISMIAQSLKSFFPREPSE